MLPAPISPTWTTALPMAARIGWTSSNTARSPPTMIDSVPSIAFGSPPLTGASSMLTPFSASASETSRAASGAIELMST